MTATPPAPGPGPLYARLTEHPDASTAAIAVLGAAGSALVAWASYVVGALPGHRVDKVAATGPYRWPYELGVGLMVLAWLALGLLVLGPQLGGSLRRVCWAGAAMATPLLVAAPLTSQDVWAYLGQGNVAAHGLDPYSVGPAAVPGPFAHAVAHDWVASPSPYGPLWVWVSRVVVEVVQPHPWAGMFVLRAVALVGLVAIAVSLVRLCRATRARPEVAVWLAVTGPFPFLMLLGGLHNDAVMLGLLIGGVAVAASTPSMWRAVLLGALLVGGAAAIKANALLAAPFLPLVWHWYAASSPVRDAGPLPLRRWLTAGAAATLVGVVVLFVSGVVFGYGFGWVPHIADARVGVQWLSVPQQVGNLAHLVAPGHVAAVRVDRWGLVHPVSLVFTAAALAFVTLTARRSPPLRTLAWLMLVLVVGSAAPRLWYLLWPLVFLVVERFPSRLLAPVIGGAAALCLWYPPSVRPTVSGWVLAALFVPLWGVAWLLVHQARAVSSPGSP